jgi:hypothetical protein
VPRIDLVDSDWPVGRADQDRIGNNQIHFAAAINFPVARTRALRSFENREANRNPEQLEQQSERRSIR